MDAKICCWFVFALLALAECSQKKNIYAGDVDGVCVTIGGESGACSEGSGRVPGGNCDSLGKDECLESDCSWVECNCPQYSSAECCGYDTCLLVQCSNTTGRECIGQDEHDLHCSPYNVVAAAENLCNHQCSGADTDVNCCDLNPDGDFDCTWVQCNAARSEGNTTSLCVPSTHIDIYCETENPTIVCSGCGYVSLWRGFWLMLSLTYLAVRP